MLIDFKINRNPAKNILYLYKNMPDIYKIAVYIKFFGEF